jgi:hypothetical protein
LPEEDSRHVSTRSSDVEHVDSRVDHQRMPDSVPTSQRLVKVPRIPFVAVGMTAMSIRTVMHTGIDSVNIDNAGIEHLTKSSRVMYQCRRYRIYKPLQRNGNTIRR